MTYALNALADKPLGLWMLDDSAPFQDHSGYNRAGTATGTILTHSSLVSEAVFSSVFDKNATSSFDSPVFVQGKENKNFALESWLLPIARSEGVTVEQNNITLNPSAETNVTNIRKIGGSVSTAIAQDTTRSVVGTASAGYDLTGDTGGIGGINWSITPQSTAGVVVRWSCWAFSSVARNVNPYGEGTVTSTGAYAGFSVANSTVAVPANTWTKVTGEVTLAADRTIDRLGFLFEGAGVIGQLVRGDACIAVVNVALPEYFDGSYVGAEWTGTAHNSTSRLLVSAAEQKVLSHAADYDGLLLNGTKVIFTTKYLTTGEARAEYDLGRIKAAHVVGVHTADKNQLYVNGELVDEITITEEQQADQFIATDGKLYTGATTASQAVAANGMAIYSSGLSPAAIQAHYEAGRDVVSAETVAEMHSSQRYPLSTQSANVFLEETWTTDLDWNGGAITDVSVMNDTMIPAEDEAGISLAGTWMDSFPLDIADDPVYGVVLDWVGSGAVVEASVDGTLWEQAVRGLNLGIVPPGFDPVRRTTLQENLAANPSAENLGTTSTLFTNLVLNPTAVLDTTNVAGYAGGETITRVTDLDPVPVPEVTTGYRIATTSGTGIRLTPASYTTGIAYTGSMYVRLVSGQATGWKPAFSGVLAGNTVTLTTEWQRVSLTTTLNANNVQFGIRNDTANSGAVIEVAAVQMESYNFASPFFHGDLTNDGTFTYDWTGATHASASTKKGYASQGYTLNAGGGQAVGYRVATGGARGDAFWRVQFKAATTSNGGPYYYNTTNRTTIVANTTYTISLDVRSTRAMPLRGVAVHWYDTAGTQVGINFGATATLVADTWTRMSVSGTSPANATQAVISIYNATGNNWNPGDIIDMDGILVESGNVLNDYFDGNSPEAIDDSYEFIWTGEENASISRKVSTDPIYLELRVTFPGGIEEDTSYLSELRVTGFSENPLPTVDDRTFTVTAPVSFGTDHEPIEYHEDTGAKMRGGSIVIGADTSDEPVNPATVEVWIKRRETTLPTISVSGTTYINGVAAALSTIRVGEWALVHIVPASAVTGSITISGNADVGPVVFYETALSAAQVKEIYDNYTGKSRIVPSTVSTIAISKPANAADVYAHDWSITGGGA